MRILILFGILFFSLVQPVQSNDLSGSARSAARELRYLPQATDFVFNSDKARLFNRALYGNNQSFRLETSDVPEFAFYGNQGMMGNLRFALRKGDKIIWLQNLAQMECRYRAGQRIYTFQDNTFLGDGRLCLIAVARYDKEGAIFRFECEGLPNDLEWIGIYGGARAKRFSRNGDLGADPDSVFCLKKDYAKFNHYLLNAHRMRVWGGSTEPLSGLSEDELDQANRKLKSMHAWFPLSSQLSLGDAGVSESIESCLLAPENQDYPLLKAIGTLPSRGELYIAFTPDQADSDENEIKRAFDLALDSAQQISRRLQVHTPDPFINAMASTFAMAADGIWERPVYLHGAIGWRNQLAGWRGAYTGDVLGWHDRAREHFSAYAASQMTQPAEKGVVMDTALNLARSGKVLGSEMYSNGYIARYPNKANTMNHYDMNLCFIDELLWHLCWTGDTLFAKEMWPVLTRHLAWEKRCFDADDDGLYEAYCCIWASDGLQYSGGGVTHATAYNYRSNCMAAAIADIIGEDPTPYRQEAKKIIQAVNQELWLEEEGHWAEFKDLLGEQLLHPSAGLWTIYHALDGDLHDAFKAHQAMRYVDTEIPHIPIKIADKKGFSIEDNLSTLSTTNWLPYYWSVNNVAFAEVMHTALAYFQAGKHERGFDLMKACLLDGMFLGSSPGNVGQVSFYDAARGESYRDFADPVGIYSRAIVQGLFGVWPDLLHKKVVLRPAFPTQWDSVSFATPDIAYRFHRTAKRVEHWDIYPSFLREAEITLEIPIEHDQVMATVNGKAARGQFVTNAVGRPVLRLFCGSADSLHVEIRHGKRPLPIVSAPSVVVLGEELTLSVPGGAELLQCYDPQNLLKEEQYHQKGLDAIVQGTPGHHSFFIELKLGPMTWWQAIDVETRPALEILGNSDETEQLSFCLRNNQATEVTVDVWCNRQKAMRQVKLAPKQVSDTLWLADGVHGGNLIEVKQGQRLLQKATLYNWCIEFDRRLKQRSVDLSQYFNDDVDSLFAFGKYLSPRSPYTSLQLPTQGYGDWCSPKALPSIDDSGLRRIAAANNECFETPQGIRFSTPSEVDSRNIVFVSQWDNYPKQINIPLSGKASHAYLLMAGSTNHIQCHLPNGRVTVSYTDGSSDTLLLVNPETWAPIEQDFYTDGMAFVIRQMRPYRVQLSTGLTTRHFERDLSLQGVDAGGWSPIMEASLGISGASNRKIPGGAAIILDMPLNRKKQLQSISLEAITNESVIGLMSISLTE